MKSRAFDARRLDVRAFARAGAALAGDWPIRGFERLQDAMASATDAATAAPVTWQVRGVEAEIQGAGKQIWLHLHAQAVLPLVCQRCLEPVDCCVALDRQFLFVADEARAAELDAELDHDVLVFSRELDVHALLEDELLLELPLVPRHDHCPVAPAGPAADVPAVEREHPFAALSHLRRSRR